MSEPTDRFVIGVGSGTVAQIIERYGSKSEAESQLSPGPSEIDEVVDDSDVIASTETAATSPVSYDGEAAHLYPGNALKEDE